MESVDEASRISVVITTIGRPELARAVTSALAQTSPPLEVIVVNDRPTNDVSYLLTRPEYHSPSLRVIDCGGRGANAARNVGIDAARGQYVALMDDDDYWLPHKLEAQLSALRSDALDHSRIICTRYFDQRMGSVAPPDTYQSGPVERWMYSLPHTLRLRNLRTLQTSGVLMPRTLAASVRFDESLSSHQDWDFIIRACARPGTELIHLAEPLYVYTDNASVRTSSRADLAAEQRWAERTLASEPTTLSNYLLLVAVPRALQRHKFHLAYRAARRALRTRRILPDTLAYVTAYVAYWSLGEVRVRLRTRSHESECRSPRPSGGAG